MMDGPWFGPGIRRDHRGAYILPCPDPMHARRYLVRDATTWECAECAMAAAHTTHGRCCAHIARALLDALAAARWGGRTLRLRQGRGQGIRYLTGAGLLRRTQRGQYAPAMLTAHRLTRLRRRGAIGPDDAA